MNSSDRGPSEDFSSDLRSELQDVDAWLKTAKYLPPILRDFHDQKDVFKAVDEVAQRSIANGNTYLDGIGWIGAQVYTIDIFLWFMARRGYTLQRSRAPVAFVDFHESIRDARKRRDAASMAMLKSVFADRLAEDPAPDAASGMPSNPNHPEIPDSSSRAPDLLEKGDG